jgi:hypothetical protein
VVAPPRCRARSAAAFLIVFGVAALLSTRVGGRPLEGPAPAGPATRSGPWANEDFFPIAVWLQAPSNAARYKAIGINLYVALWRGPTEEQLAELERSGMAVICSQNEFARAHLDRKSIVGWMHGDEPDNAQELPGKKGYGPPVAPEKIVASYRRIQAADPTRPVLLNLGQGVAWDGWHGRGVRSRHPEDYPEYVKGCDIASFDIYPAVHDRPEVAGKLWYVPRGVKRLREWAGEGRAVWNCIECTRIGNKKVKPSPEEVKAEVWMSLIHGSRGLIYFCHQFEPKFIEAGLLADEEMARAVGAINRQVAELAAVLHGPELTGAVSVESKPGDVSPELKGGLGGGPVAAAARKRGEDTYVFAVRMEPSPVRATLRVKGPAEKARVEVLGEDRALESAGGAFEDDFGRYAVHLYRIR